jgi:hypothetical protein
VDINNPKQDSKSSNGAFVILLGLVFDSPCFFCSHTYTYIHKHIATIVAFVLVTSSRPLQVLIYLQNRGQSPHFNLPTPFLFCLVFSV